MVETIKIQHIHSKSELDSDSKKITQDYKWDIYWPNCIVLVLLHVSAIYGYFLKPYSLPATEIFAKIIYCLSSVGITAGAHRLWCHRAYKATTLGQIIIMFIASMTYQNSIYVWCRDHRMHHKYSETDADPHNANRGFFFSHVGWLMVRKHPLVKSKRNTVDLSDLEENPIVMFQHKYYYPIVLLCGVCITTFLPWYCWGESLKISFFRATIHRYIFSVHLTWSINSFAHLYGNKPYDRSIGPVESTPIKYLSGGEAFHNYHHTFPWDYKASEYGNDTKNPTTIFIDTLASLGLVYDRKTVPLADVKRRMDRTGDESYNTNNTIFHKYLPKTVDLYFRNAFNIMVFAMFLYII